MSEEDRVAELRRFLKERRARIRPADVGLPAGGRRRVPGLRREEVAALAGIGVSWYTDLENGTAGGVSAATLSLVADALRLSESERHYLLALAGQAQPAERPAATEPLVFATLHSIAFPAYIISATWDVVAVNAPFRRLWSVDEREIPFNAVARLFLDPAARAMHGARFIENVRPVIAMLHSSLGRMPHVESLRRLRDRLEADDVLRMIWNEDEISSPLLTNSCTIESALGMFSYQTLTLPLSDSHGIVVQVPDESSRERLGLRRQPN